MTELDTEIPGLAFELISEYGADINYIIVSSQTVYDPKTSKSVKKELSLPIKAFPEDYDLQNSGQGFANGIIVTGDKKLTTAAEFFNGLSEPSPGHKFNLNGTVYTVKNVKTVYSGQLPALYEIQGRE